jgi:hypothetical protein
MVMGGQVRSSVIALAVIDQRKWWVWVGDVMRCYAGATNRMTHGIEYGGWHDNCRGLRQVRCVVRLAVMLSPVVEEAVRRSVVIKEIGRGRLVFFGPEIR